MLELTTLKIGADTKPLEALVATLKDVRQALSGLEQPLTSVENVTKRTRKGAKDTSASVEEVTEAVDKQGKKMSAVEKQLVKRAETLKVMRNQEIQAADGTIRLGDAFTRSQSSSLAMLKILGATTEELKQMAETFGEMNRIMGVDPFDKSTGNLRAMKKEVEELNYVNKMMQQGINLSQKELQGLSRDIIRVTEAMKAEGTTAAELAKAVQRVTNETVALSKAKAIEEQQVKGMEAARKAEAKMALDAETLKAQAIQQTNAAMKRQEELLARSNAKLGYMQQGFSMGSSSQAATMKMAGVSDDEINTFLSRMKMMEDASRAARKAEADRVREAKKNSVGHVDANRKAASAVEWLRLTEERLKTQLEETDNAMRKQYTDTLVKLRENLKLAGLSAGEAEAKFKKLEGMIRGVASKENTRNLDNLARAVSVQMGDVGISLASGMNPLLVMIQQGDQIRGAIQQAGVSGKELQNTMMVAAKQIASSFVLTGQAIGGFFTGAIISAGKATTDMLANVLGLTKMLAAWEASAEISAAAGNKLNMALFNLARAFLGVTAVGAATAMISFAVGAFQAMRENDKLARSLALTNGALTLTHSEAFTAAAAFESAGGSAGKFLQVVALMGKTGELTASQMDMVAKSAIDLQKFGGVALEDTVKRFADLQKDPVDALIKLQKETGMVSTALIYQVQALANAGREYEAGKMAVEEYSRVTKEQTEQIRDNYTWLGRSMIELGQTISDFWDKYVIGLFRKTAEADPIAKLEQDIQLQKDAIISMMNLGNDPAREAGILAAMEDKLNVLKRETAERKKLQDERYAAERLSREALSLEERSLSQKERLLRKINEYELKASQARGNGDVRSAEIFLAIVQKTKKELSELDNKRGGGSGKSPFEKAMEVYNDLLQNTEGNSNRFNDQVAALQLLLNSSAFVSGFKNIDEARASLQKVYLEIAKQQPGFREAEKQREEYLKRVTKETQEYEKATGDLEVAMRDAMMAEYDHADSLETETKLMSLSNQEREKVIKLLEAEAKYKADISRIEGAYTSNDPNKAEAEKNALRLYAQRVQNVLTDAHVKSVRAYLDELNSISKSISDVIATALFEGGRASKKKLRDILVSELRKRITLQIDAFINPIVNAVGNSLFGSTASAAASAAGSSGIGAGTGIGIGAGIAGFMNTPMSIGSTAFTPASAMSAIAPYAIAAMLGYKVGGKWFEQGFDSSSARGVGRDLGGLGIGATISAETTNILKKLGVGDKMANLLSGSTVIGKLFGRSGPKVEASGIEGTFSSSGFSGQSFTDIFQKGGVFRRDKRSTSIGALDAGVSQGLGSSFQQVTFSVKQMAETLGIGTDAIEDFTYYTRLNLNGLSEADAAKAIEDEFKKITDAMVDSVANLKEFQRYGESSGETMARLADTLGQMNSAMELLGWNVYQTSLSGFSAADTFANLFGGVEKATDSINRYYNDFYTAQEKTAKVTQLVSKEFSKLGVEMPTTIEGFRALVEQIKATGDQQLLADVISMAGSFSDMLNFQKESLADYTNLQKQLLELQGNTAALRELEIQGLDATSAALQRQIWALQDMKAAQEEYAKFVEQYTSRGAKLREFVEGRQGGGPTFDMIMAKARTGDIGSIDQIESSATREIENARNSATTLQEAQLAEMRILGTVLEFAQTLENFSGSSLEEQVLAAQQSSVSATELNTTAINSLTEKLLAVQSGGFGVVTSGNSSVMNSSIETMNSRMEMVEANTKASALSLAKLVRIFERLTPDGDSLVVST